MLEECYEGFVGLLETASSIINACDPFVLPGANAMSCDGTPGDHPDNCD